MLQGTSLVIRFAQVNKRHARKAFTTEDTEDRRGETKRVFRKLVEAPWVKESAVLMNLQQEVSDVPISVGHTL